MLDSRRYLSTFAVISLVFMRLVIGWHFFGEGGKKLEYDRHDGQLRLNSFSAEGFLSQAKGPLAGLYHSQVPDDHGFREVLTVQRQNVPPVDAAEELAPPYQEWLDRITADWQAMRDEAKAIAGLSDEQKAQADAAYTTHIEQVKNYLASESEAIADYRHELWRLENMRNAPEADEVPFHDERIVGKAAEISGQPLAWRNQVRQIEAAYREDLRAILTAEQRESDTTAAALTSALTDSRSEWLHIVNWTVTWLTVGVGVCLLLGFFTRLTSIIGALFLLSVILSQPPWLPDAESTINQCIEFAGLLVLAGTGAGRWAGLDYFTWAIFRRRHADE